jgi:hypothetical protein
MRTIRIAGGVGTIALLLVLGACGGAGSSADTASTSTPPNSPPDTTAPTVAITTPTASGSYSTANATVALGGTTSDNVGVTSVTWTNAANNINGTASLTSPSWSIASVALALGSNAITVTAQDAAGNNRNATLTVTYNPGGGTSLSGSVDSSLINRSGPNAVYVYSGTVTPGEIGSGTPPLTTAPVSQDNNACTFGYQVAGLAAGTYTVAFANQTDNPGVNDAIVFKGTAQVTVGAGGGAIHDFAPNRRLQVGPTRTGPNTFTLPSAASASAQNGDVVEIDAGEYLDDIAVWRQNNLTLRGVGGGRAYMHSTQIIPYVPGGPDTANGKAIWVTAGQNTTVENIEFSGAKVPDENGAGITADGPGLTVCNGYFHDNENGILGGAGIVLIEYSEFNHNGHCPLSGGCSHNMYINEATTRFTLQYSYSHRAHEGHLVKSRAQENHILYNRIMDEDGDASYEIDLPQTGLSFIIGNLIQKGTTFNNSGVITFGVENANNPVHELYVVNNTIVNDSGSSVQFLSVGGGFTPTIRLVNNIFASGSVPSGTGITSTNNLSSSSATVLGLPNRASFDYHLSSTSQAINAGTPPGTVGSVSLTPISQYVHPISRQDRPVNGAIDIGAYEFQ